LHMLIASLEILEDAQFPPAQVRALAKVFESFEHHLRSDWVTVPVLDSRLATLKGELKADISSLRGELKADIGGLRNEIHSARVDTLRWTFIAVMSQGAASVGIMYFLLQHAR
jgi:hypothetical protein